jgi:hypothetical protein
MQVSSFMVHTRLTVGFALLLIATAASASAS